MRFLFAVSLACFSLACSAMTQDVEPALADVFTRVDPAVVTLHTAGRDVLPGTQSGLTAVGGLGSGVLIDAEGSVLTAAHVVQTVDEIQVEFADGTTGMADVIAADPSADVALIRLRSAAPESAAVAPLADSDSARVGERVFVIGAPLGISHTLSVGYLSARRQRHVDQLAQAKDVEFFQTDAAINKGNSGGPMFNMRGEILGIVSHISTTTGGNQGLGFAVTANVARELVVEGKSFWSGVDAVLLDDELAEILNVPEGRLGILVQRVSRHSPSADLGLRDGDLLSEIGGRQVVLGGDIILAVQGAALTLDNLESVREALNDLVPGDLLSVSVLRSGKVERLETTFMPAGGRRG